MALYLSFREADCPQFNSTVLKSYILTFIPNEMERIKWPKTGTAVEAEEGCTCPVGGDIESVLLISVCKAGLVSLTWIYWPGVDLFAPNAVHLLWHYY